jgi:TIR domain
MENYPIIEERSLPPVRRGTPWGLGSARRSVSDLPRPRAHEVVVYRWGSSYVIDDGRARLNTDHIVKATSVCVVDMREDAPVMIQVPISSAEVAADFTVQVTFLCTVKRAEEVVETGLTSMTNSLWHYLVRHERLLYLGEQYHLEEINTVRRNVWAEVKAYTTLKPPQFRGMDVKLGNVQVLPPDLLARRPFRSNQERSEGHTNAEILNDDSWRDSPTRSALRGHVFISYVREDSLMVDRMQSALEASGVPVWRDSARLWPGEDWREKIRDAITEDALVFLACFSNKGLAKEKTYQNQELTLATEQMRLRRPGKTWLIPVRFDNCDVPDLDIGFGRSLSSIHSADLIGANFNDGVARLTSAILKILG